MREGCPFAVTDVVIPPGDEFAVLVYSPSQILESARTIVIVLHIVFARPQHLDRRADGPGDPGGLAHVIVIQPTPESAAAAHQVDGEVAFRKAEQAGDHAAPNLRRLGG